MNLQPDGREEPEINLTPLIDVVFLLLIFFMVSTTFEHQSRIRVELPEASADASIGDEDKLEIIVDAQGRYFINERQVVNTGIETLKKAITIAVGDRGQLPVVIRADANATHQSVITLMDATSQLGLTQISLATTKATDE